MPTISAKLTDLKALTEMVATVQKHLDKAMASGQSIWHNEAAEMQHFARAKLVLHALKDLHSRFTTTHGFDANLLLRLRAADKLMFKMNTWGATKFNTLLETLTKKMPKAKLIKTRDKRSEKHANTMIRSALWRLDDANKWNEPDMIGMLIGDAADHLEVAHFLYQGLLDKAAKKANYIDTASREEIPEAVWNYLMDSKD